MAAKFGPAGLDEIFYAEGGKSSAEAPSFLRRKNLDAFEYQCTRGVKISESLARKLGDEARNSGVSLSIHGPYYINFCSGEAQIRANSCGYVMSSLEAAHWMGAEVVVFHPGQAGKKPRAEALEMISAGLMRCIEQASKKGFAHIKLAPETGGKKSAFGGLDEIIALAKLHPQIIPCVDFAHLHAREGGCLNTEEDFDRILDALLYGLGESKVKNLHCHFSPIEFTAAGEKRHWTTLETQFGPDFLPLARSFVKKNIEPTVICESNGRQSADAQLYRDMYRAASGKFI
ncbi:MAG: TIM barrel protein [Bacillota bacterium]